MELLIWLWIWDKRFFFTLQHHPLILANIWLLPIAFSLVLNMFSYKAYQSQGAIEEHKQATLTGCTDNDLERIMLQYYQLQSINIVLLILTMIKSHQEKDKHVLQKHGVQHYTPLDYWHRQNTVCSIPGVLLFFFNLVIYIWSIKFQLAQSNSLCKLEETFIPGAELIMAHSVIVLFTTTFAFTLFIGALILKLIGILSFVLCPRQMLMVKKCISSSEDD